MGAPAPSPLALRLGQTGFQNPACRLRLALYGHPDSGGYWEKKFNSAARKGNWRLIENWPSCFFHPELKLVLIVYVDDFKMAGPSANLAKGWASLRGEIKMGDPEPFGRYLGCDHQLLDASDLQKLSKAIEFPVSKDARGMAYDMGGCLALAVARFQQLAGVKGVKLRRVDTPFVDSQALDPAYNGSQDCLEFEDDQGGHPITGCRTPANRLLRKRAGPLGTVWEPVQLTTKAETLRVPAAAAKEKRAQLWAERSLLKPGTPVPLAPDRGELASIAASVLMQVLFAARMARPDLLKAINYLARRITLWTKLCDRLLHRLMCYINSTLDLAMVSIVGDSQESLQLELYVDADLAGDPNSKFSTSGVWFGVGGPHTRASLCCLSKRQTSRAFSTAEAEIVAYALGLRTEGLPGLDLWETILQRRVRLLVWEDNKSTEQILDSAGILGAQTFPVRAPTRSAKVPTLDRQANSDFVDELLEDFRREQEPHLPNVKSRCLRAWDASRRRERCRSCVLALELAGNRNYPRLEND